MLGKKVRATLLVAGVGLGGCASVDHVMGNISNTLDSTGDVLSGDFRAVATATPVTLNQIWTEWKKNEVNASNKYLRTRLSISGIVISVSKTSPSMIHKQQFAVIFRDPSNRNCRGVAYTRDALMVQEKRVGRLSAGDRIRITAVMDDQLGSAVSANANNCFYSFSKATFEPEAAAAAGSK